MTDAVPPLTIARQGTFFAGGTYRTFEGGTVMSGQMFVEYQIPAKVTKPYPIVLMHGNGQTGDNFKSTPDGRPGWADYFLAWGYAVYIVDQIGRGRSALTTQDPAQATMTYSVEHVQRRFTTGSKDPMWPQAALHTQWPGSGERGDVTFDQYYASTVPSIISHWVAEDLNAAALTSLFDRIGPAIILTHSQTGGSGWRIGDARPELVKGIVAIEPMGPAFHVIDWVGPPDYMRHETQVSHTWGISRGKLTYDPPVSDPAELLGEWRESDGPGLAKGRMQSEPARKLVNLAGIPIVIVTGEASYHAGYDHLTSAYLTQAGVKNTHIPLQDRSIHGNSHMMMLEKNNGEIARLISDWLEQNVR